MKKSSILIISAVMLIIIWMLFSGWLQANAYMVIKSGQTCSYANNVGKDNFQQFPSFKNIKVDFETNASIPLMNIKYSKSQEISFSNRINKDDSFKVSGDTLYLRINYKLWGDDDFINIGVPTLNSVTLSSASDMTVGNHNLNDDQSEFGDITISGIKAKNLSIINNCQYILMFTDNKLVKLKLSGSFRNGGIVKIMDYSNYDSLDVDIKGREGKLRLGSYYVKNNPNIKQWINIKASETFRIEAPTSVILASKITIKK